MLSNRTQDYIKVALADEKAGSELVDAISSASNLAPAADVAAVSPGTVAAVTVADNTQASINTALASIVADIQANRTAINAILSALKAANLMS